MSDPIAKIAEEVAKQVPAKEVYNDLAAPAVRQVGGALESVAKTLRLAHLPFEVGSAYYDRISALITKSIGRVPEEERVAPPPQILGPVVEGIRYEEIDSPISDMFEELLSKAFSSKRVADLHPWYPNLIRQLSSDEAIVLRALMLAEARGRPYRLQYTMDWQPKTARFTNRTVEIDEMPREALVFPDNFDFYLDHLHSMGLAGLFKDDEQVMQHPSGEQSGTRVFQTFRLTALGKRFMDAVSRPE